MAKREASAQEGVPASAMGGEAASEEVLTWSAEA
jgi:hypothetical protein